MEYFSALSRSLDAPANISRRRLLANALPAAAALPVLASSSGVAAASAESLTRDVRNGAAMESRFVFYDDPREHQKASYRILRNTHDDADVLFWYHFTMFAVVPGKAPQAVVRWEGTEMSHHRKLRDGIYQVHGHNLSFPRDIATGNWTDSALNPMTGKVVEVPPMALTGDPGYVYMPEGVIPLDNPEAPPRRRIEQFMIEDDLVKIEQVRLPPASWPATFVETSANWSSRALFEDTDLPSLPCGTAGGYIFPWPEWMGMGDSPGHMFATWHGRKLGSARELPEAYIERAVPNHEALLSVDLTYFDKPLPEALAARVAAA